MGPRIAERKSMKPTHHRSVQSAREHPVIDNAQEEEGPRRYLTTWMIVAFTAGVWPFPANQTTDSSIRSLS